eukprot:GEMP01010529.1.p1 GENE.GEMP01010529.1~~GEMP01010529.1.p1  ORF type:complete len:414 (+),score=100.39 GEMP01010529.1:204-1445(+)
MRFWQIFKKTRYEQASSTNVATLLSQHAARKKGILEASAGEGDVDWKARWAALTAASVTVWGLLAVVDKRLEDPERCRQWAWEPGWRHMVLDVACSRLGSHLGPFQVKRLTDAQIAEEALRRLSTDLDDHEKLHVLARIEQQTSRGVVTDADYSELFRQLNSLEGGLFDAALRIALDLLSKRTMACPDELAGLVGTSFGATPRDEELKAWIVYLLLLHPENARRARNEPLVMEYLQQQGNARYDIAALWKVKRALTSGETHDILRKSWKLIQEVDPSLPDRERQLRETLDLEQKIDFRCLETSLEGTLIFTLGAALFQVQAATLGEIAFAARKVASGMGAIVLLETLFRAEEFYSRFTSTSPYMTTFGYALVHPIALVLAWRYAQVALWPLAFIRLIKDPLSDSARLLGEPDK